MAEAIAAHIEVTIATELSLAEAGVEPQRTWVAGRFLVNPYPKSKRGRYPPDGTAAAKRRAAPRLMRTEP